MEQVIRITVGTVTIVLIFMVVASFVAIPIKYMWDYVMPSLFGLPEITFWQAMWGTVMCRMLFTDFVSAKK
jgi:hypothetical protein